MGFFPAATIENGKWWVLRVNDFPDHPLYTLFVDGQRRFDLDDRPEEWRTPAGDKHDALSIAEVLEALSPVIDFDVYGSEVGQPCDNAFCCARLPAFQSLPRDIRILILRLHEPSVDKFVRESIPALSGSSILEIHAEHDGDDRLRRYLRDVVGDYRM